MKNIMRGTILLMTVAMLMSSCASTKTLSWVDGTYDNEYKEKDYWCATGLSVDETHALGNACSTLEKEMTALLGHDADTPSVDVEIATGNSGVVLSPTTGNFIVYASVFNSEKTPDNKTIVRIGVKRSDIEKSLKKMYGDTYDDASYALKHYKNVGKNPLDRIASLQNAERLSRQADRSAKLLKLFSGKNYDSVTEKIVQTRSGIISDLKIRIDASMIADGFRESMVQSYASELKALGFNVVDKKEDAVLKLSYKQLLTMKGSAPYAYVNYTLGYTVLYDGQTILSFVENERIAGLTDNDALSKAAHHATIEAPQKFSAAFQNL